MPQGLVGAAAGGDLTEAPRLGAVGGLRKRRFVRVVEPCFVRRDAAFRRQTRWGKAELALWFPAKIRAAAGIGDLSRDGFPNGLPTRDFPTSHMIPK